MAFLRRIDLPIEPRKRWPDGGMPLYKVKGNIAAGTRRNPEEPCVFGVMQAGAASSGKANIVMAAFDDDLVVLAQR